MKRRVEADTNLVLLGGKEGELFDEMGNTTGIGVNIVCQFPPGVIRWHNVEHFLAGTEENNQGVVYIVQDLQSALLTKGGFTLRFDLSTKVGCHCDAILSVMDNQELVSGPKPGPGVFVRASKSFANLVFRCEEHSLRWLQSAGGKPQGELTLEFQKKRIGGHS